MTKRSDFRPNVSKYKKKTEVKCSSFVNIKQRNKYKELIKNLIFNDSSLQPQIGQLLERIVKESPSRKINPESEIISNRIATSTSKLWQNALVNEQYSSNATTKWIEDDCDELKAVNEFFPKSCSIITAEPKKKVCDERSAFQNRIADDENLIPHDIISRLEIKFDSKRYDSLQSDIRLKREVRSKKFLSELSQRIKALLPRPPSPLTHQSSSDSNESSVVSDDEDSSLDADPATSWKFPILSNLEEDKINLITTRRDSQSIFVEEFNIPIYIKDIQTLKPARWLNDEVINFYFKLIVDRSENNKNLPTTYAFSTFFYPKLFQGGHAAVKRWTRKVNLFDYELLLIPIHLTAHWALVSVHVSDREIRYYDSLNCESKRCLEIILKYLAEEYITKKEKPLNTYAWRKVKMSCCQQLNADDCGVFACQFAEALSRQVPIYFNQGNMPFLRRKMILEIAERRLISNLISMSAFDVVC